MILKTLYVARHPDDDRYYADPEEWAVFAAGNPKTAEKLRHKAARLWKVTADSVIVDRYTLVEQPEPDHVDPMTLPLATTES